MLSDELSQSSKMSELKIVRNQSFEEEKEKAHADISRRTSDLSNYSKVAQLIQRSDKSALGYSPKARIEHTKS